MFFYKFVETTFSVNRVLIVLIDMLLELARREKAAGIIPDQDLDIFMKVHASIRNFFFSLHDNLPRLWN